MGVRLEFSVEGDTEFIRELDKRSKKAKNLKSPLQDSVKYMMGLINQNYSSSGGVWGRWPRRKYVYSWPILNKTGDMKRGFRSKISTRQAVISNTQPYFKYHQSKSTRKYLPRRVMMAIQTSEVKVIKNIFQRYITD